MSKVGESNGEDEFKVPDVSNLKVSTEQNSTEQPKMKTIVFCIPGRQFKSRFLLSWSELLLQCLMKNYIQQEHK